MASNVRELAPLDLVYKPDAAESQRRMRAYWAGDMIDRPCLLVRTPEAGKTPPPFSLITAPDFDFPRAIAEFEEWASCMFFGGESMPAFMPNYGPDQWAAFLGARNTLVPEMDTSWIEPFVEDWAATPPLSIDPGNKWWNAILDLTRLAAQHCDGRFILSTIDTHSNIDCLSPIRGPARLCMDLIEDPDAILERVKQVDAFYRPVYDAVFEAGRMAEFGSTSWLDMYSEGRTGAVQCDFCYMISPEHFRKFVLPSLEYEVSCLDHAVYHLDGAGQLADLDDLLAIPGLHTIQWVPGAGQPAAPAWIELLQKIQKAGKAVQIFVNPEELKAVHSELAPEKTFYWVVDCPSEDEARGLIRWLEIHV